MRSAHTLRNLAVGLMAIAVLLMVYVARMGGESRDDSVVRTEEGTPVVVAAHELHAGEAIDTDSVMLEFVGVAPPSSFRTTEELIGRTVSTSLEEGEVLMGRRLGAPSQILAALGPGERAMAVKVDGVIGLGGFVQPGDSVDVLLYLPGRSREVPGTRAQVLLEGTRIVAFGEHTENDRDGKPVTDARTAVLAVPADLAPRLMLGAHAGSLRLSLRTAVAGTEPRAADGRARVTTMREILGTPERQPSTPSRPRPVFIYRAGEREVAQP